MRTYWLLSALILSAILSALNFWAVHNHMYWRWIWLDIPMHLLGGIATSVFIIALLPCRQTRVFALTMAGVFVGWEIFEYFFKLPQPANYPFDTAKDLFMDTCGAGIAYCFARLTIWKIQ